MILRILRIDFAAAALLGFIPLGQTVYLLALELLGLPHHPGQFAVFASAILAVPTIILLAYGRSSFRLSRIDLAVLLFLLLMMANLAFRTINLSLRDVVLFCLFVVGPYAAARLLPRDLIPAFLLGVGTACAAAAMYTIAFVVTLLDELETVIRPKLLGVDHGVHLVGMAFTFLICIGATLLDSTSPRWKRIAVYVAASLSVAVLVILSSRGMLVVAFVTVFLSIFLLPRESMASRVILITCMAVSAYATLIATPKTLAFLVRLLPGDGSGGLFKIPLGLDEAATGACATLAELVNSSDIRMALYGKAVDLFVTHPLFGVGLNNYDDNFCPTTFPHSSLLQIASELGLVGLVLAGALVYLLLPKVLTICRHSDEGETKAGLILMILLICSLAIDQLYGNLLSMVFSMAFLGAVVSWLSSKPNVKPGTAASKVER